MKIKSLHEAVIKNFFFEKSDDNALVATEPTNEKTITRNNIEFYESLDQVTPPGIEFSEKSLKIKLDERFLTFVWSVAYYSYVTTECSFDKDLIIHTGEGSYLNIEKPIISKALGLIDFAREGLYSPVDFRSDLPNPVCYQISDPRENNYILQTNFLYSKAIAFFLFHEYGHIYYHHRKLFDQLDEEDEKNRIWYFIHRDKKRKIEEKYKRICAEIQFRRKEIENEADNYAFNALLSERYNYKVRFNNLTAAAIAKIALLLYGKEYKIKRTIHPDIDQRVANAILYTNLQDKDRDYIWMLMLRGIIYYLEKKNKDNSPYKFSDHEEFEESFKKILMILDHEKGKET